MLRHRLEQRRLRLGHGAVDLVDEHGVGEDRPGAELEVACVLVVDRQAGHVGRLEIRRALDPRVLRALDAARDRPGEHGLRGAGHVLEEHVASACERGEDELDLLVLATDDRLQVRQEAGGDVDGRVGRAAHPARVYAWIPEGNSYSAGG